ncbi:helix-turn-helix domain-containing GNAT family N-acetyltransferase [Fodinicola feengrottensis]|uniref:Helix-turn-helix domain-containing GNAT family N-acetyltransferase n=1 Tax=Fodinicola feengrottensis TaxID=435914 RepID=A0ABN2H1G7_9ACTN
MDAELVARVRTFNRTVTQRVGALQDRFLGRDRALGEARLLWEIGPAGQDVRTLRAGLGLDSGYLSRLLRSLEAARLVTVDSAESDRRVRIARLTSDGIAERRTLDRRSDELAELLLEPLSAKQRERLAAAMAEVELLLRAGMIEISDTDPEDPHAQHCLESYFAELNTRFDAGFDVKQSISASASELRPPTGLLVVARLGTEPVGCGALRFRDGGVCDLKRMWVAKTVRGMGLGRRLLGTLEMRAYNHGSTVVRLETNKNLTEAISLYRSAGFTEVAAFNDEKYAHHWFQMNLAR